MAEYQKKLDDYRAKKHREEKIAKIKEFLIGLMTWKSHSSKKTETTIINVHDYKNERVQQHFSSSVNVDAHSISSDNNDLDEFDKDETVSTDKKSDKILKYVIWVVYFLIWATMFCICIELQFGIVYLMFSALVGIYLNTRTGPKKSNEISAYSVFNKNCESIDGTLKAEQFEREMGYKP